MKHKGYNNVTSSNGNSTAQKFKYNGVEFNESLGLDLYEMDVRSYDPAIARFTGIDPVIHHSMSTYTAFDNNPIFWADPSGADAIVEGNWSGAAAQNMYSMIVSNLGGATSNSDNNEDCDDCKDKPAILRLKVADPKYYKDFSSRAKTLLNPFRSLRFKVEGATGYTEFLIDKEGYINIDLNNIIWISESNAGRVVQILRRLKSIKDATQMAKFVRNSNWFKNTKLKNYLTQYFRVNAKIGNGSSASALMHEVRTGVAVGNVNGHFAKVAGSRNFFVKLLNSGVQLTKFEKKFIVRQILEANRAIRAALKTGSKYPGTISQEALKTATKYPF